MFACKVLAVASQWGLSLTDTWRDLECHQQHIEGQTLKIQIDQVDSASFNSGMVSAPNQRPHLRQ